MMVIERIKKIISSLLNDKNNKLRKYFYIAMLAILVIIAIVFVDLNVKNNREIAENAKRLEEKENNIVIGPTEDEEAKKLINDYFKARTDLNFARIFSFYGRDYYKEERDDKNGELKKIIDSIRYEKIFVKSYENIMVYSTPGYYKDDLLCIVTYDLALGFTTDVAPMMIIFYLEKKNGHYIIKNNLDVGISKYIVDIANTDVIKDLYNDVVARLTRVLVSNESLRLSYNSLRQYEMNMGTDLGPINSLDSLEKFKVKIVDPIRDADEIHEKILKEKEEINAKKFLEDYLEKFKASMSEVERVN